MSKKIKSILATDCGSTTTKAVLIEWKEDRYRLTFRGEAPTTVEAPFEDVTKGVLNAVMEVEELSGRTILDGDKIINPDDGSKGVDIYVSTSSAGGGLQMMVAGVVKSMSGESAERAALGAGSIVMDVLASNDGRLPHEKITRIRQLRPDMILLSGGTDGGTTTHVMELAEILAAANPRPRLGQNYKLPVIYAGNNKAQDSIRETLGEISDLDIVDNIRPVLEQENLYLNATIQGSKIAHAVREQTQSLDFVIDVRQQGLMIGIELGHDCPELMTLALKYNLLISVTSGNVIRIVPPLVINDDESEFLVSNLILMLKDYVKENKV